MSAFALKMIAIISMTCDHLSYLIFGKFSFLNCIGRIAFPIFAFQITEGYIHTNNLKKYFLRLFVFSLISQIPFMLYLSTYSNSLTLNVFFTLLLGLASITIYDKLNKIPCRNNYIHKFYQITGLIITIILAVLATLLRCDYTYFGVLIIFAFFIFKDKNLLMSIAFIFLVLIYYGKDLLFSTRNDIYLIIVVCTIIPLLFINLYNNKKGKDTKYFLYIFYPLHLLIIYALNFILL